MDRSFAFGFAGGVAGAAQDLWADWRHDGEIDNGGNTNAATVDAALDIMLAALKKGDTLVHLFVYAHGDADGFVHAKLKDSSFEGAITSEVAKTFATDSPKVQSLQAFVTKSTALHVYACNAGKQPEALGAMLELFTGGNGAACGPDRWFHIALLGGDYRPRVPGANTRKCKRILLELEVKKSDQLETEIQKAEKALDDTHPADEKCWPQAHVKKMKAEIRKAATKFYEDDTLLKVFAELQKASLVPPDVRTAKVNPDRAAILTRMWQLWDLFGGHLAYPFLAKKLLDGPQIAAYHTRDAIAKDAALGAVLPRDAGWSKHWVVRPTGRKMTC